MGKTRIFASTGRPILHSASPQMHNAGFRELGMDAVYIRLSAASAEEALLVARQIGMSGMSITSPLKEKMLALLDRKDARVQKLGAVNTVKLEGGKASGFNTDGDGVSGSLAAIGVAIKGKRAVVLGAGGAAKAAVCALAEAGANVTVAARKKEKASALARQFGCESCLLEGEGFASAMAGAEIVVSALNTHERVVPPELFRKGMTVLDATYSAEKTGTERLAPLCCCSRLQGNWRGGVAAVAGSNCIRDIHRREGANNCHARGYFEFEERDRAQAQYCAHWLHGKRKEQGSEGNFQAHRDGAD